MKQIPRPIIMHNLFGMLYARWRLKRFLVIPYENTYLKIHRSCQAIGTGRLLLGIQWESGRYMPSQMVMRSNSKITVNSEFRIFSGHSIWVNQNASLILGSGYINNNFRLSCFERVEIGHNVAISENVTIRDSDNYSLNGSKPTKPITIGNNVWIGMNATILKGVSIGDGAVVAAGAVVNRDVPPKTLVVGVPAVVKKKQIEWR